MNMLILAVDTSTRAGSLAVLRGDKLLAELSSVPGEPYSTRMFTDLDRLLGNLGVGLGHFDLFAVGAGPGSFTGLRVGITAVKAWGELYGRPIVAVSGLEAVAVQITDEGPELVVPVIDARRGQVFGAVYQRAAGSLKLFSEEVVMGAEEFLGMVEEVGRSRGNGGTAAFGSPAPEVIRPALERSALAGAEVHQVSGVLAPVIGRIGYERALRGETVGVLELDANYVRRSDAESKWKD